MQSKPAKKPRLLILGTGMKRSSPGQSSDEHLLPGVSDSPSLYEMARMLTQRRLASMFGDDLVKMVRDLPTTIFVDVLHGVTGKLSADQLVLIEQAPGERSDTLKWRDRLEDEWMRLCSTIRRQTRDCPPRLPGESPRSYHGRLQEHQRRRLEAIGSKLRDTYREGESMVRTSKLINPRRSDGKRLASGSEPLGSVKTDSQLMKRARIETISAIPATKSGNPTFGKMILPRKR